MKIINQIWKVAAFIAVLAAGASQAAYQPSAVLYVDSIAALRLLVDPANIVCTKGYYSPGDAGAGCYNRKATDSTSTDDGGNVIVSTGSSARYFRDWNGLPISTVAYGVKHDEFICADGSVTNGLKLLSSACASFASSMVGRSVTIGSVSNLIGFTPFNTTIDSVAAGVATLHDAWTGATCSGACRFDVGTDDTTALNKWRVYIDSSGKPGFCDTGRYKISATITSSYPPYENVYTAGAANCYIVGFGMVNTVMMNFLGTVADLAHHGTWSGMSLESGSPANNVIGVRENSVTFFTLEDWQTFNLQIGFQPYNGLANAWTEYFLLNRPYCESNVYLCVDYKTTVGTGSFRGTGVTRGYCVTNGRPVVVIEADISLPYFSPMNMECTVFDTPDETGTFHNGTKIVDSLSVDPRTYGWFGSADANANYGTMTMYTAAGGCVPAGTTVTNVTATQITMSANATCNTAGAIINGAVQEIAIQNFTTNTQIVSFTNSSLQFEGGLGTQNSTLTYGSGTQVYFDGQIHTNAVTTNTSVSLGKLVPVRSILYGGPVDIQLGQYFTYRAAFPISDTVLTLGDGTVPGCYILTTNSAEQAEIALHLFSSAPSLYEYTATIVVSPSFSTSTPQVNVNNPHLISDVGVYGAPAIAAAAANKITITNANFAGHATQYTCTVNVHGGGHYQ